MKTLMITPVLLMMTTLTGCMPALTIPERLLDRAVDWLLERLSTR